MQVERYEQFFGLHEPPFSLAPNPRYLFESGSHVAALDQVAYAIERREPLVVITGEIGTGKTLLCRTMLARLERKTFVSVINNPLLERDDLLKQMLQDFGVIAKNRTAVPTSRHDLVHALEDFLSSLIALQAHAVVLIDEAQHMRPDVLEQIRLLSNIDDARGTMLQIILVGQASLEALLSRPDMRQFQQRVSRRVRLEPLSEEEVRLYIEHRVTVAHTAPRPNMPATDDRARAMVEWNGTGQGVTFTPNAVQAVWMFSAGLPRLVNLLCDRALEAACAEGMHTINVALIDRAAFELKGQAAVETASPVVEGEDAADHRVPFAREAPPAAAPRSKKGVAVAAAVLVAAGLAAWAGTRGLVWPFDNQRINRTDQPASTSAPASNVSTPTEAPAAPPPVPPTASPVEPSAAIPAVPPSSAQPAVTTPAPASEASAAAPSSNACGAAEGPFDILVASFRTEARAASVVTDVGNLGLPIRQRVSGEWQQVVAGPFASCGEAEQAHQRLERAGLTGTRIAPASH